MVSTITFPYWKYCSVVRRRDAETRVPPQTPLTPDEIFVNFGTYKSHKKYKSFVYLELRTEDAPPCAVDILDAFEDFIAIRPFGTRYLFRLLPCEYGKEYRLWGAYPTDEERNEARWND